MAEQNPPSSLRSEQRIQERLPLRMNALLIARGMNRRSCLMKDICSGGALLELREGSHAEDRQLGRGEVVLLRLSLGEGEELREHELRARIAHADQQLFGVSFFHPDPSTLDILLAVARADQAARRPVLSDAARALLERLGQQVQHYCREKLTLFFRAADLQLLDGAEHGRHPQEQHLFFDAATDFRKQKDEFRNRFMKELVQSIARLDQGGRQLDVSGLAQADKEQFEEWLVVKVLATRVEDKCREPLLELQTRLDEIGQAGPGRQRNPFSPAALCEVFQHTLGLLRPAPEVQKTLYRVFEDSVLANLGNLYEALNNTLIQEGVLPQLSRAGARIPEAPPSPPADEGDTTPVATPIQPAPATAARPQPPRSAAEFLERAGMRIGGSAANDTPAGLTRSLRDLLELQRLHPAGTTGEAGEFGIDDLVADLATLKAAPDWHQALAERVRAHGEKLSLTLQSLLQVVDGLIQALAQNELVGERARPWFRALELPLLHALLQNDDLLQQEDHPARQVLDRLARLGFRDQPLGADQQSSIDGLVTHIARHFDHDPEVFRQALAMLDPLITRQEQGYRRNLERVRQLADGEYRLATARRQVQELLDQRLAGRRVPQPVLTLLDAGWRDLLVNTLLRHGEHSQAWQDYSGLLDELLAIAADVHRPFDLRHILRLIKTGLQESVDLGGRQQQLAIKELRQLLSGPLRLVDEVAWVQMSASKERDSAAEERWLQKWMERARRLQLGDWLELRHRGAEPERLRLAWRDSEGSRFVFVNHRGVKVNDFSLQELATLMHTGNVLVFEGEDTPLVDDALEQVVHQLYEKLAWQASHDELTGLANRSELLHQLERALDAAKRQQARHVLACINLDQFQLINRQAGHDGGNELLREVSRLFSKALTPKSTVARLHGDEFALLLEDCDLGRAQQLVSLRLAELSSLKFATGNQGYKLTASAGLADVTYTSDSADRILRAAEDACAEAKRNGGNRIQVHQPSSEELARRDSVMAWVARLNQALEEERLNLRCQRIRAVSPEREASALPHYEILLGMKTLGGEDLPPSEFVQAAERYKRMLAVDRWVVDSAFHWLHEHADKLARIGMISINLSAHSLSDAQTMSYIFDRLLEYRLPPEKICFEVTETAAINNIADAADLMRELKKIGCRFALDDFGAGHAGYHYLKHLPLDFVKIDGSFVRDMAHNENDYVMVRSINDLAHCLGLKTVAECVEDAEVLQRLQDIGVDYAQGFAIERPCWLDSL